LPIEKVSIVDPMKAKNDIGKTKMIFFKKTTNINEINYKQARIK